MPTVPGAVVALVMMGATPAAATVTVRLTGPLVPLPLVAVSATTKEPAVVGVPVMSPVRTLSVRPGGIPTAAKLEGEPVAAIA